MDLVLDLWVNPNRTWAWKDRDDYNELLSDYTLDESIVNAIEDETEAILAELDNEAGPFAPEWLQFEAEPAWQTPELIATHKVRGSAWSFPPLE